MKKTNTNAKGTNNGAVKKEDLLDNIMEGYKVLKETPESNKSLIQRIVYTWKQYEKDASQVPKDILTQLSEDVATAVSKIGIKTPAPVETSPKPKLSSKGKAEETKTPAPTPTKEEKSSTKGVKPTIKKKGVETTPDLNVEQIPLATIFPETLENEDFGTLTACPDVYQTMEEIADAINDGKTLIFATYWTTRHIKKDEYAKVNEVPVPKNGFPNDLDLLQVVYVCTGIPRLYAISAITEAIFYFTDEDLARLPVKAPNGDEFTMRYSNGLEFEIYEAEGGEDTEE